MPKSREHEPARIKEHLSQRGKEQITNVDNSRTDKGWRRILLHHCKR